MAEPEVVEPGAGFDPLEPETPRDEIGRRSSKLLPVLHAAAMGIGLETIRRIQVDAADRTKRDYRVQEDVFRAAAGLDAASEEPEGEEPEPETDMGDMMIVGELNVIGGADPTDSLKLLKGKGLDQRAKGSAAATAAPGAAVEAVKAAVDDAKAAMPDFPDLPDLKLLKWLKPLATGLLGGAVGLGALGLYNALSRSEVPTGPLPPAVVDTDTDSSSGVTIKN